MADPKEALAPLDAGSASPATSSAPRPWYWSLRRELWESRSIYLAPLAVGAVFLFGFLLSLIRLPQTMRAAMALDPVQRHEEIVQPYELVALAIMAATFIVGVFYCLDALYGERRDRSLLFWKSLPVSDRTTVLAKASIAFVFIPLLTVVIVIPLQLVMLLVSSLVLLANGLSVTTLWAEVALIPRSLMLLNHMVVGHVLWYAPIYGWLLLVSAWARRAPLLWASLPLVAIGVVEKLAFDTSRFANLLARRMAAGGEPIFPTGRGMETMMQLDPVATLHSPGLWLGLAVAAAFLLVAARLRRYRA